MNKFLLFFTILCIASPVMGAKKKIDSETGLPIQIRGDTGTPYIVVECPTSLSFKATRCPEKWTCTTKRARDFKFIKMGRKYMHCFYAATQYGEENVYQIKRRYPKNFPYCKRVKDEYSSSLFCKKYRR